jgi:hypothetical protein
MFERERKDKYKVNIPLEIYHILYLLQSWFDYIVHLYKKVRVTILVL